MDFLELPFFFCFFLWRVRNGNGFDRDTSQYSEEDFFFHIKWIGRLYSSSTCRISSDYPRVNLLDSVMIILYSIDVLLMFGRYKSLAIRMESFILLLSLYLRKCILSHSHQMDPHPFPSLSQEPKVSLERSWYSFLFDFPE